VLLLLPANAMDLAVRKPDELEFVGNVSENYKKYVMQFDIYIDCLPETVTDKQKAMLFLNLAGTEAMQREKSFTYKEAIPAVPAANGNPAIPEVPGESRYCLKDLKAKFLEICEPRCNVIMERHAFNSRRQEPGESFNTFYSDLRVLAQTCAFDDLRDDLIRDRIVMAISDDKLRKLLLRESDLTLSRAVTLCQIHEQTELSISKLSSPIQP
jgi:hypothetical protein